MSGSFRISHIAAGLTAVVVGYSSSVVIVIEAARQAGANETQIISWLLVLGLGMGISCLYFSLKFRMPVVTAWSTPGAVFLISTAGAFTLAEVTGALIGAGVLSLIVGRSRALLRGIERIPPALAAAMLAGILLPYCLKVFSSATHSPLLTIMFVGIYLIGSRFFARYLMLVLLLVAGIAAWMLSPADVQPVTLGLPALEWVTPAWSLSAFVSIGIPLFLITMLSQNLPGISILHSHQYKPDNRFVLTGIALLQLICAPFGGFMYNLAAITAAICMADSVDDDPSQRYKAGVAAGLGYLLSGVMAVAIVSVFTLMPIVVTHLLAGIALFATLQSSLLRALEEAHYRQSALMTMLCSASGLTVLGMSAPVWGLLLGVVTLVVANSWKQPMVGK
ncbi:benzoate/H(+) symporter BenE family transporter [Aestuariibacter sp. GS-14]|uniref:benzoate/H(+) symporter BenE family transporter n=1 Tax=Aestuariibacter sp. GS-14 TaxID=2590670 RepID=UPI00112D34B9|nr:benzoate/H(+) symporter BenE family transporter [Aestuariibacter sp. GS-14]TPV57839.1 benzoate/H(+) symporter BenE family transporter [Aestuariibacter sp. GS-14]